jgi:ubiquinone/menaquinone biosynthesis C-methylase UbiE/uncharacterized protein YbaR (Trm112 family)
MAVADGRHAGGGGSDPVNGVGIGLAVAGAVGLGAVAYWQLIIAEGAYLGPRAVAKTYDWVARRYDNIKQFHPRDESWFVAMPLLRELAGVEPCLILDVATGTGRLPLALVREGCRGQLIGLDLSKGMLHQAQAKLRPYGEQVTLIWQDADHLPFDDGTFDAVTCLESLEFLPRPLEAVAEMVRVLMPGGVLFVTNRVGREAHLLPGRAIPRSSFEQALKTLALHEVRVQPWQVAYDLAVARKEGSPDPGVRRNTDLPSVLRCARCGGRLQQGGSSLACTACEWAYPIHDGIVHMADAKKRGET